MPDSLEITPEQAHQRLGEKGKAILIDVREPEEFALARLEGSLLIPMQSVPAELQKLEALADDRQLLILCHHGVRSLQVTSWLRSHGVENCYSIAGGIHRWSQQIDPTVPIY